MADVKTPVQKKPESKMSPAQKRHADFKKKSADIKADGGLYICKRPCTYGIAMYRKGVPLNVEKGKMIPWHFRKATKAEEEKFNGSDD